LLIGLSLEEDAMTGKNFETTVHYHSGVATIDLSGDLTALVGAALDAAYRAVESQRPEIIWLNFSDIKYINSSGIALIIGLLAQTRQTSRNLMAYGLPAFYVELFKLAGLTEYMPVYFAGANQPV
jgi:anti-anti-sigma factor